MITQNNSSGMCAFVNTSLSLLVKISTVKNEVSLTIIMRAPMGRIPVDFRSSQSPHSYRPLYTNWTKSPFSDTLTSMLEEN